MVRNSTPHGRAVAGCAPRRCGSSAFQRCPGRCAVADRSGIGRSLHDMDSHDIRLGETRASDRAFPVWTPSRDSAKTEATPPGFGQALAPRT
ncbi:hypothetical protein LUTEI9C_140287 [Luteimonas sp. 9C]|nr:hypothetical protein LUTEI9C_140287 [Luteimonas sp. 9C]